MVTDPNKAEEGDSSVNAKPTLALYRHRNLSKRSLDILRLINGINAMAAKTGGSASLSEPVASALAEIADYGKSQAPVDYGSWAPFHLSALRSMALDSAGQ